MNYRQPGNSNTNKLKTDATHLSLGNIPLLKDYHRTGELPTSRIRVGEENIALGDNKHPENHMEGGTGSMRQLLQGPLLGPTGHIYYQFKITNENMREIIRAWCQATYIYDDLS